MNVITIYGKPFNMHERPVYRFFLTIAMIIWAINGIKKNV